MLHLKGGGLVVPRLHCPQFPLRKVEDCCQGQFLLNLRTWGRLGDSLGVWWDLSRMLVRGHWRIVNTGWSWVVYQGYGWVPNEAMEDKHQPSVCNKTSKWKKHNKRGKYESLMLRLTYRESKSRRCLRKPPLYCSLCYTHCLCNALNQDCRCSR